VPKLRLALAQVDPTVGDIAGNAAIVLATTAQAAQAGADLVAFPEMMLTGYPVEDLVFRESFVAASRDELGKLATRLVEAGYGDIAVVLGYLDADGPARTTAEGAREHGPRNALAVLHQGRIAATTFKHHLPNYGVFDEDRYFVSGDTLTVIRLAGVDIGLTICEDLWQTGGPFAVAASAGVGLVLNINGSPYELNKDDVRLPLVARRAEEAAATVAYVNMVGGQDELVFDGDSMVVAADGTLLARAPQFQETVLVHDLDLPAGPPSPPDNLDHQGMRVARVHLTDEPTTPRGRGTVTGGIAVRLAEPAEIWQALVLGLRDYVRKNGFGSVLIALSGGIDSSVVAAIAVDAVGPANVTGVSMPSRHSSDHSRADAAELAERTGLRFLTRPIQPIVDAFDEQLQLTGLAAENLQARVRGVILMALSNQDGHLVLTTGNKSELAVGYSTLYGDAVGGFNPIKDVPKSTVWQLARWRNGDALARGGTPPIPERSITKPPSAELRPDQLDTDSLPEYPVLDAILAGYIDGDLGRDDLVAAGHDAGTVDRVLRLVDLAEYKRRQAAPGPKISIKAFGRDRRLPITNRFQG
jgi:NAD+ synthase (glutamine-hydrolysing)